MSARYKFNGFECRGSFAALFVDYFVVGKVNAELICNFFDLVRVAYQECFSNAGFARVLYRFHYLFVFCTCNAYLLGAYFLCILKQRT